MRIKRGCYHGVWSWEFRKISSFLVQLAFGRPPDLALGIKHFASQGHLKTHGLADHSFFPW